MRPSLQFRHVFVPDEISLAIQASQDSPTEFVYSALSCPAIPSKTPLGNRCAGFSHGELSSGVVVRKWSADSEDEMLELFAFELVAELVTTAKNPIFIFGLPLHFWFGTVRVLVRFFVSRGIIGMVNKGRRQDKATRGADIYQRANRKLRARI